MQASMATRDELVAAATARRKADHQTYLSSPIKWFRT